jgi:hypothetical protein
MARVIDLLFLKKDGAVRSTMSGVSEKATVSPRISLRLDPAMKRVSVFLYFNF